MIFEESPEQDTKAKPLKRIDNIMANFKNKQNKDDNEDTNWNDNQLEQTLIEPGTPKNTIKDIMTAREQVRALRNTSKDTPKNTTNKSKKNKTKTQKQQTTREIQNHQQPTASILRLRNREFHQNTSKTTHKPATKHQHIISKINPTAIASANTTPP